LRARPFAAVALDGTFVEGQSIKVSIEDGELDFS
jgi:hypothetical protein